MDILIKFGFTIEEIKNIMDSNIDFENLNDNNINELINILLDYGCTNDIIKNIFITNPFIFNQNNNDIFEIINFFKKIGNDDLVFIFNSNPYLLNVKYKTLDDTYKKLISIGYSKEDIIDYFYYDCKEVI